MYYLGRFTLFKMPVLLITTSQFECNQWPWKNLVRSKLIPWIGPNFGLKEHYYLKGGGHFNHIGSNSISDKTPSICKENVRHLWDIRYDFYGGKLPLLNCMENLEGNCSYRRALQKANLLFPTRFIYYPTHVIKRMWFSFNYVLGTVMQLVSQIFDMLDTLWPTLDCLNRGKIWRFWPKMPCFYASNTLVR